MTFDPAKIYAPRILSEGFLTVFETKSLSGWHEPLGTDMTKIINPDFYAFPTFNGNAEIGKLISALQKNSLLSVKSPVTAVKLYHSKTDDFVPYTNAEAAHAKWSNSTLVELSSTGHFSSGMEFMLKYMGFWELINP